MIQGRIFKMWLYSVSHKSLLFRSEMQYLDVEYENSIEPNITIDIEFSGVEFMSVPTSFTLENIQKKKKVNKYSFLTTYEIKHDLGISIIEAASCIIGTSKFIVENRLVNSNLDYDEDISEFIK